MSLPGRQTKQFEICTDLALLYQNKAKVDETERRIDKSAQWKF